MEKTGVPDENGKQKQNRSHTDCPELFVENHRIMMSNIYIDHNEIWHFHGPPVNRLIKRGFKDYCQPLLAKDKAPDWRSISPITYYKNFGNIFRL